MKATKGHTKNTLANCKPAKPKLNNALVKIEKTTIKLKATTPKVHKTLATCKPAKVKVNNALAKIEQDQR